MRKIVISALFFLTTNSPASAIENEKCVSYLLSSDGNSDNFLSRAEYSVFLSQYTGGSILSDTKFENLELDLVAAYNTATCQCLERFGSHSDDTLVNDPHSGSSCCLDRVEILIAANDVEHGLDVGAEYNDNTCNLIKNALKKILGAIEQTDDIPLWSSHDLKKSTSSPSYFSSKQKTQHPFEVEISFQIAVNVVGKVSFKEDLVNAARIILLRALTLLNEKDTDQTSASYDVVYKENRPPQIQEFFSFECPSNTNPLLKTNCYIVQMNVYVSYAEAGNAEKISSFILSKYSDSIKENKFGT